MAKSCSCEGRWGRGRGEGYVNETLIWSNQTPGHLVAVMVRLLCHATLSDLIKATCPEQAGVLLPGQTGVPAFIIRPRPL